MTHYKSQKPKEPEKVRYLGEDGRVHIVPIGVRVPCHPRKMEYQNGYQA